MFDYAADKVKSGQWAQADSLELSRKAFHDLLPQDLATPDNHLFNIVDDTEVNVGILWIAVQSRANQRIAYVYDVGVRPAWQRKGHASRAFAALEERVRGMTTARDRVPGSGSSPAARASCP